MQLVVILPIPKCIVFRVKIYMHSLQVIKVNNVTNLNLILHYCRFYQNCALLKI